MAIDVRPAEVAQVRVARRSLGHDLRAVKIVLHRELLRFYYDRTRMVSQLVQPVLYLLVLGTGLGSLVSGGGSVNLKTFIFPGVIAMSVMFTGLFSAASIVWDRGVRVLAGDARRAGQPYRDRGRKGPGRRGRGDVPGRGDPRARRAGRRAVRPGHARP